MDYKMLDNDKFSKIYTIAFKEPISKKKIAERLTKSGRKEYIIDENIRYFKQFKRVDNRLGKLIQSKINLLVDYIDHKVNLGNDKDKVSEIFDCQEFRSLISVESGITNHNEIIHLISALAIDAILQAGKADNAKVKDASKKALKIYDKSTNFGFKALKDIIPKPIITESDAYSGFLIVQKLRGNLTNETLVKLIKSSELGEIFARIAVNITEFVF